MEVTESTKIRLRTRKIKKDHTMTKFYLFLTLVILLLLVAALAPHIVPYDPYAQDLMKALSPPVRNIRWGLTGMVGICFPG